MRSEGKLLTFGRRNQICLEFYGEHSGFREHERKCCIPTGNIKYRGDNSSLYETVLLSKFWREGCRPTISTPSVCIIRWRAKLARTRSAKFGALGMNSISIHSFSILDQRQMLRKTTSRCKLQGNPVRTISNGLLCRGDFARYSRSTRC